MTTSKAPTHPGVAAVLSFIFSGLGQIYNGDLRKGFYLVGLTTTGLLLVILGAVVIASVFFYRFLSPKLLVLGFSILLVGGIIIGVTGIYSIKDAYKNAKS